MSMEVVRQRCAGADVHKKTVVVHIITSEVRETRTFVRVMGGVPRRGLAGQARGLGHAPIGELAGSR